VLPATQGEYDGVMIGMDVNDEASHLVVLDDAGAVVVRDRIATKAGAVRKWFASYAGARVALEVGRHSPWLSRLLKELGLEVIVANPRKVALIHWSDTKNDRLDLPRHGGVNAEVREDAPSVERFSSCLTRELERFRFPTPEAAAPGSTFNVALAVASSPGELEACARRPDPTLIPPSPPPSTPPNPPTSPT
jgi:hypothetical protein